MKTPNHSMQRMRASRSDHLQFRTCPSSKPWLPPVLGTSVGLLLLFLTELAHQEGPMLDLARCLHYPSNEFMLAWDKIFPLNERWSILFVEGTAFVAQWVLLALCVAWVARKLSHEMRKMIRISLGFAILMVALGLTLWAMRAQARVAKMNVSIRFLGYTNDPVAGVRTALIEISNASPFRVMQSSSGLVYQSRTMTREYYRTVFSVLGSGDAELLELDAPTNRVPW